MPLFPRSTHVDSPMTQGAYENQRNARTSCGGWVSTNGGGSPAEGYAAAGGYHPGCAAIGGFYVVLLAVATIVAIVCFLKLDGTHRLVASLTRALSEAQGTIEELKRSIQYTTQF